MAGSGRLVLKMVGGWAKKLVGCRIDNRWEVDSQKGREVGPANRWQLWGWPPK